MRKSPITCKDLSRLASEAMDRDLSWWERVCMKMHLWVCKNCQRYVKHLAFLRKAAGEAGEVTSQSPTMPDDVRERMKKALEK